MTLALAPHEAAYPGTDASGPLVDVGGTLMSAPYCLAVAIRKRNVRVADLRSFDDESLMSLVRRVSVAPDETSPGNSCRISIRTRDAEVSADYIATPETFNWDRHETSSRLRSLAEDMPLDAGQLHTLVDVALDLESRSVRDLVLATIA